MAIQGIKYTDLELMCESVMVYSVKYKKVVFSGGSSFLNIVDSSKLQCR